MARFAPGGTATFSTVKPGDVLILKGKTLKGKNRIREHGDRWLVREVDRSVLSANLGFLVGPEPTRDDPDGYARWVRRTNDEHFEIVEVVAGA